MSSPFSRTLRALETEGRRAWIPLVVAAALLAAWTVWFVVARVALYETSTAARLEVAAAVHPIDARMTGRAVRINLAVGERVHTGDILIELEADAERLAVAEAQTRRQTLTPEIEAVRSEIAAEERAIVEERRAAAVARDEQRALVREAQAALDLALEEARRVAQLRAKGIIPELDDVRARAEIQRRRAAADASSTTLARLDQDQKTRESDRAVRIQRLRGTVSRLQGETRTTAAAVSRLEYEVERRLVRAPVDGRLAEAADLRPGAVVEEGDRIAAIIPDGKLRVVAQFLPDAAIGRVRPGQPARVRLTGFPWAQYGSVGAVVTRVADEVRDGLVRVELSVTTLPESLPVSHALPGSVEIEVERVRPVALVLRTIGGYVTRPVANEPAPRTTGT
jgi:multidrug resistance efflux pump